MSQRVLVFESDASFADEVKRNFERMGLAVDVAGDGPSGLELASAHPPALILLAIELPGMNGFLVCKKIKKMAELEHVPLPDDRPLAHRRRPRPVERLAPNRARRALPVGWRHHRSRRPRRRARPVGRR